MNQANKDFLKRYERNYETLKQADFIGHLELSTRQELARIAREEFDPNYTCCVTCQEDIFQLVKYVYGQAEKAEREEARQAAHEKATKQDSPKEIQTVHMTFPLQTPDVTAPQMHVTEVFPNPSDGVELKDTVIRSKKDRIR